jgi:hypothetical protein
MEACIGCLRKERRPPTSPATKQTGPAASPLILPVHTLISKSCGRVALLISKSYQRTFPSNANLASRAQARLVTRYGRHNMSDHLLGNFEYNRKTKLEHEYVSMGVYKHLQAARILSRASRSMGVHKHLRAARTLRRAGRSTGVYKDVHTCSKQIDIFERKKIHHGERQPGCSEIQRCMQRELRI